MAVRENLTGQKFGKLTCLNYVGSKNGKAVWLCKCDCGNEISVVSGNLKSGNTNSCGCFKVSQTKKANSTHGLHDHPIYNIWCGMKDRCCNPNNSGYFNYGGRGISICPDWEHNFQAFYNWAMSNGWEKGLSIDRIDVNGNYEPNNCRWITLTAQCVNKRTTLRITYKSKCQSLKEWSEELGMNYMTLQSRLARGWSVEKSFTRPIGRWLK